jgi:hypothetical protein
MYFSEMRIVMVFDVSWTITWVLLAGTGGVVDSFSECAC